jgi:hypothetical protein
MAADHSGRHSVLVRAPGEIIKTDWNNDYTLSRKQ